MSAEFSDVKIVLCAGGAHGRRFVFNIGGRAGMTCVWGIGAWGCLPL